ncbi:sigma-54 interaction domain-containing protein [Aneurinibacillus terranovensis]|uniref:sigma-54 interaction domain-containing protein n=1 Tax=Aneurinibacillus terranovensis TaxID=278991 RepID=UPI00041A9D6F|nr:sigma 54-interacting transcriptional regulator [Aneurinibacillus terranovensis]
MLSIQLNKSFLCFFDLHSFYAFVEQTPNVHSQAEICFIGDPSNEQLQFCRLNRYKDHDKSSIILKSCSIVDTSEITRWVKSARFTEITVLKRDRNVLGWAETVNLLAKLYLEEQKKNRCYQNELENMNLDMKSIFDAVFDEIFVTDGNGMTLMVSSSCQKLWGFKAEEMIGKSVYELEENNIFNPSLTRLVLEHKEKVSIVQNTTTGRKLLATGIPILDDAGNISRVVTASRDITEIERLRKELDETRTLLVRFKEQLEEMSPRSDEKKLVYESQNMKNVMTQAKIVAEVDSTVLITGESGVGKEEVAEYIHRNSNRADKAFIKINCGSIPETLIESELFGYEKGAFTGASPKGKIGLIEAAHKGTLFLDEIGDLPLTLQVKLLRVLQEREMTRVGGTVPFPVDIRIIAATNKDLAQEIELGKFREDLYYRLNIIPLTIPPLRERKEDIIPLVYHFQNIFNRHYHRNKHLSTHTVDRLVQAPWKGNIRELKNTIERLIVLTEKDIIEPKDLPLYLNESYSNNFEDAIEVKEILPLKKAKMILEKKLMEIAVKKYPTMTEIAKILEVNQSTISRIFNKIDAKKHKHHEKMHIHSDLA